MRASIIFSSLIMANAINPTLEWPIPASVGIVLFLFYSIFIDYVEATNK
jgi:putative effector of murein hydrolase LrgA (UPF0299 family)